MNVERLSLLATILEQQKLAANTGFDLTYWFSNAERDSAPSVTEERVSADSGTNNYAVVDAATLPCGTTACAIGHAALIPEFQAQGFKLVRFALPEDEGDYGAMPYFDGRISWEAVNRFFDLDGNWADYLFMSGGYGDNPQPKDVAIRIRELIADHAIGEG